MVAGQCGVQGGTLRLLFNLSRRTVKSYCGREMKDQVDTLLFNGEIFLPASKKPVEMPPPCPCSAGSERNKIPVCTTTHWTFLSSALDSVRFV